MKTIIWIDEISKFSKKEYEILKKMVKSKKRKIGQYKFLEDKK